MDTVFLQCQSSTFCRRYKPSWKMNTGNLWIIWMVAEMLNGRTGPLLTCWRGSLLSTVLSVSLWVSWEYLPLVMVFVIALLPVTGTTHWTEPARPLGLHFYWHSSTWASPWIYSLPSLGDSVWEVLQGYLRSGEVQQQCWAALPRASMRDWACNSPGGQKWQTMVTALFRAALANTVLSLCSAR